MAQDIKQEAPKQEALNETEALKQQLASLQAQFNATFKDNDIVDPYEDKSNQKKQRYIDVLPVKDDKGEVEKLPVVRWGEMEVNYLNGGRQQCNVVVWVAKGDKEIKQVLDVNEYLRRRTRELATVEEMEVEDVITTHGTVEVKEKIGGRTFSNKPTGIRVAQAVKTPTIKKLVVKRDNGELVSLTV